MAAPTGTPVGTEAEIDLGGFGAVPAEVRSISGDILGLMFLQGEAHERELARHLIALPPPRRVERRKACTSGAITVGGVECTCVVEDISRMGACVLIDDTTGLIDGDRVVLTLEGFGRINASVRHLTEIRVGLMFLESLAGEPPS